MAAPPTPAATTKYLFLLVSGPGLALGEARPAGSAPPTGDAILAALAVGWTVMADRAGKS